MHFTDIDSTSFVSLWFQRFRSNVASAFKAEIGAFGAGLVYDYMMQSTGRFTPALRRLVHYSHNRCSRCGSALEREVAAYAGYDATGLELYVGQCCVEQVRELASHMYWWWSDYPRPAPDTIIWRYMDFSKLVAMLNSQSLYFARADTLGDPFEGARGVASRKEEWKAYCLEYYRNAIRNPPEGHAPPPPNVVEEQAERLYQDFERSGEMEVRRTFVSCWHANPGESEAQWRLYATPGSAGIALRTTFGRLDQALDQNFDVRGGFVRYIDFATVFAGTYDRIFWKRAALSHEAEVRAVLIYPPFTAPTDVGISVPTRIADAIEAIVVSPFAPVWVEQLVRTTVEHYNLALPVQRSSLLDEPFF